MTYKRGARLLYRLYAAGLCALSAVRPLFRLALRVLTGRGRKLRGHVLPVNMRLGSPEQRALGRDVLEGLIGRSVAVAAMNECLCRAVGGCREYPADLGCLVLGEAVNALHPGLGRAVSRAEAMEIADRALALGLVPMVVHFKSDADLWSLEHGRMLTVCFCCPCHCLVREALGRDGRRAVGVTGLPGVAVSVRPDRCAACGRCAEACFTGALAMEGGKPRIDEAACVACGRCAMACARGAISVRAEAGFDAGPVLREYGRRTNGKVFKQ